MHFTIYSTYEGLKHMGTDYGGQPYVGPSLYPTYKGSKPKVIASMSKSFMFLVILSGLTIFDSVTMSFLSTTHAVFSLPIVGRVGIWTIIVVYIGAVVDISLGSRIFRYIQTHRKVRK